MPLLKIFVPEKHLTWLAPSVEGKELCIVRPL